MLGSCFLKQEWGWGWWWYYLAMWTPIILQKHHGMDGPNIQKYISCICVCVCAAIHLIFLTSFQFFLPSSTPSFALLALVCLAPHAGFEHWLVDGLFWATVPRDGGVTLCGTSTMSCTTLRTGPAKKAGEQWKKGPWLFRVYRGLHYTIKWGF